MGQGLTPCLFTNKEGENYASCREYADVPLTHCAL